MFLTWLRLPQAWKWGGLSFKELAIRTYQAVDKHETIDRAAIVAFYALLALVPFLGLVLTITLGASDGVVTDVTSSAGPGPCTSSTLRCGPSVPGACSRPSQVDVRPASRNPS